MFYRVDDVKVYIDRVLSAKTDYVNEFVKNYNICKIGILYIFML